MSLKDFGRWKGTFSRSIGSRYCLHLWSWEFIKQNFWTNFLSCWILIAWFKEIVNHFLLCCYLSKTTAYLARVNIALNFYSDVAGIVLGGCVHSQANASSDGFRVWRRRTFSRPSCISFVSYDYRTSLPWAYRHLGWPTDLLWNVERNLVTTR
jgi:hypothetical protein